MPAVIEVEGLVKRYGPVRAVDGLSFEVLEGEVFALLGPNGAGKTTTVEVLEGFRRPDEGTVRVLGIDPREGIRRIASRVGVMPQSGGLWAGVRASEAVRLFASFYPDPMDVEGLLVRLGLDRVRRTTFRRLSGGEQQRLSLALALVGRPELAFLDEPTAGMDVHARATTWELIRELRDGGVTVLLTTHLLDEAERVADRVAIVHRGRLVALGPPGELSSGDEIRLRVTGGLDAGALGDDLGVAVEETGTGAYRLPGTAPTPELVARLTAWLAGRGVLLRGLTVGSPSLEEVFLELTREEE